MECPKCFAKSVIKKDGTMRCQAKGCPYMSYHVITYENENRQFQQKGTPNRFSMMSGGAQHKQKQNKLQTAFRNAAKTIRQLVDVMHLSQDTTDKAQAILKLILKLKYSQEYEKLKQSKDKQSSTTDKNNDQKEQKTKNSHKIRVSNENIAAYSLYAACYEKDMFYKDVRIANQLQIPKDSWGNIVKQLNQRLEGHLEPKSIPTIKLKHVLLRVCIKQKIRDIQTKAMLQLLKRMSQAELLNDNKWVTIAGCVFWQIMIRSSYYNGKGQFSILNYLKKNQKRMTEGEQSQFQDWRQSHFDGGVDTIRKFKNKIEHKLPQIIPYFEGRISEEKIKHC